MEVKKISKVTFTTTDGKELKEGSKVVWCNKAGECFCGIFKGLNSRNALVIDSILEANKTVNIQPRGIAKLFIAQIDIMED